MSDPRSPKSKSLSPSENPIVEDAGFYIYENNFFSPMRKIKKLSKDAFSALLDEFGTLENLYVQNPKEILRFLSDHMEFHEENDEVSLQYRSQAEDNPLAYHLFSKKEMEYDYTRKKLIVFFYDQRNDYEFVLYDLLSKKPRHNRLIGYDWNGNDLWINLDKPSEYIDMYMDPKNIYSSRKGFRKWV